MLIGYARVSTADQNLDLQIDALRVARCEHIFQDQISGNTKARLGLDKAMAKLQPGDVLIVWKLDRLGRSLSHLIGLVDDLAKRQVGFRSISEALDTTSASGRLLLHMMAALAEFERSLIAERTAAGIKAAKSRGVHCGRPAGLTPDQVRHAKLALEAGESPRQVAALFCVGKSTLYRALQR